MTLNNFQFNTTPGLRFGSGQAKTSCKEIIDKLGSRILFITDKGLMSLGLTKPTIEEIKKKSSIEVFDDVEADPSQKTLLKAIEIGRKIKATGVIGFGGGSSMDVAKLSALILGSNEDLEKLGEFQMQKDHVYLLFWCQQQLEQDLKLLQYQL